MNGIIKRIKREMKRQGISQKLLAERVGVTPCTITRYFNGSREPSLTVLENMARAVNLELGFGENVASRPLKMRVLNVNKAIDYLYWGKDDEPIFGDSETDIKIMDFLKACSEEIVFEKED